MCVCLLLDVLCLLLDVVFACFRFWCLFLDVFVCNLIIVCI